MADGVPLHEPVEEIARRLPYKLACAGGTGSLRYGELADAADRLAARLVAAGVGRDDRVGLFLARGPDLAVGILGVLRAGAAYLPLGIADPPARVAAVIADAAPRCVLVHGPTSARFTGDTMVLDLDASTDEASEAEPVEDSAAAYVVYTSGSTGAPRGVVVEHRNLARHIAWLRAQLPLAPGERLLQMAPVTFDAAMTDFFWPLSAGATVVFLDEGAHLDPRAIVRTLVEQDIVAVRLPPAMLPLLLAEPAFVRATSLRYVICGGDRLPSSLARGVREALPGVRLFNRYGPTETAVAVTYHEIDAADVREPGDVPIGFPVDGVDLRVDNGDGIVPLAPGRRGELIVCGASVARGYLGDPDLTARRFVQVDGAGRGYRTGDWVSVDPSGALRFVGRRDEQVQIAGYRVEPGEVRANLLAHQGVVDCVVTATAGVEPALVAYVVPAMPRPSKASLRAFLLDRLPRHMVPGEVVFLSELPTTDRGKPDLAALARRS